MSDEEAAAVPLSGMIASGFLKQGKLRRGQKILVNGAGGSIGNFTVQIAHAIGAEVTAVDSAEKFDMLRSIGADRVIDYTKQDFTESGKTYDAILDVIGRRPYAHFARALKRDGVFLSANPSFSIILRALWNKLTGGRLISIGVSGESPEDLAALTTLIEAGKVKTVIDRCFPLEQLADAHRYAETGRKQGNIIITVTNV